MNIAALQKEFKKLEMHPAGFTVLQDKDGVTVLRLEYFGKSYVLKYFEKPGYRREIKLYNVLKRLGIPTLHVASSSDASLLLEDLSCSPVYRLGEKQDMADPDIARALARWYKALHQKGAAYAAAHANELYDESDFFTRENIARIKEKTDAAAPVWDLLEKNFDALAAKLQAASRTLTYNDFYYTNLAVAKDKSTALMFDYNLLGKGFVYTDLRNVTYSLSPEAGAAFLEEYGSFPAEEVLLDDVVSPIVTLHMAFGREAFPAWGEEALAQVLSPAYCEKIRQLL
ncbi:MAG: hypothetical protein IKU17_04315 [Clostridia bacterium]|nr:hypothetical protein [Clostridia bacterium]